MKKILTTIFILFSVLSFSQEKIYKHEIGLLLNINKITTESGKFNVSENNLFSRDLGIKYRLYTKYEMLSININMQYGMYLKSSHNEYSSYQINIPIGYSLYFFKKTWFNPSVGVFINNNFIFNEEIKFSYGADYGNFIPTIEENKIDFRYQIAFALNAGLSFTIKKRYTLNVNGFVNIFSNYKLNPKGDETIPYSIYGYNFGFGYKF